jgi:hypothetical protein
MSPTLASTQAIVAHAIVRASIAASMAAIASWRPLSSFRIWRAISGARTVVATIPTIPTHAASLIGQRYAA